MEPAQLAKMARDSLTAALNAIQSCDDAPDELFDVAEPIAQTITILRKIERGAGNMLDGRDIALKNVRKVLADVQAIDTGHPAADEVLEAVASSLAKVNALARWKGQASVPPPAEPAAPKPAAAPAPQPKPVAAPAPQPEPAPLPPSIPRPAPAPVVQHIDEPRHLLDARPTPAPQPVVQSKPVVVARPEPAPAPQPVVQPKVIVAARPEPAPAPQPVVQPKVIVAARPEPAPAPQPVVQPKVIIDVQPAPAPQPVIQPKPVINVQAAPAPAPQPVVQAKPVETKPAPAPAPAAAVPAPESKAAPKKVAAPPAPPGVRTLDVPLGTRSVSNFYKGLSGNDVIEHGGVFVETYRIPKIGTQVQLHVLMPGDYEFYALATVQWTREAGGSVEPGFGARFTQIGSDGRQLVYRYTRNREPMFYDDL